MLNARRHRDDDQAAGYAMAALRAIACSTPGGIETMIRTEGHPRLLRYVAECSTPGGIETMIRLHRARAMLTGDDCVLNARRHRDDDQMSAKRRAASTHACSTPGGIETMIRRAGPSPTAITLVGAQRPEASRRDDQTRDHGAGRARRLQVLNARRHRDDDQVERRQCAVPSRPRRAQRPEASRR